jgi:ParB family transcriptional regulator, chromosome partitioning protein
MTAGGERRSALGRGLGALLPTTGESIQQIDIDLIAPNPDQPRKHFESAALDDLAESISRHGILQPLIVTRQAVAGAVSYSLIAGERRLQAARRAGLARVPAIVREAQANQRLELALVENIQRADLDPLEEAEAFRRLTDEFGLTQEEAGRRVGRGRVAVANALRLLGLPAEIRESLARGEISAGHARALLGAEGPEEQVRLLEQVRGRGLNVRQTEELVRSSRDRAPESPKAAARNQPDGERAALEEHLREALSTQVELQPGRRGGRIVIRYYDDEDLQEILEVLLRGRGRSSE